MMRKTMIMSSMVLLLALLVSCQQSKEGSSTRTATNGNYITNRQPLEKNPYIGLPLGSVKARGWLQKMLKSQKTGATGHLDKLYPQVMGKTNGWLGGKGDQWERGPYWIHGLLTLAYTLDDEALIEKTTPWIEWILNSQKSSGYFG